jgi:hypothetical protein
MARLLIHVEGQTEEAFVNEVLRDHLVSKGYHSIEARIVGSARRTGGICAWPAARKEIVYRLREDPGCVATTMVDYYGLPSSGDKAWPGRERADKLSGTRAKAKCVHDALEADLLAQTGDVRRFVPSVVMHEFEGLLFSDCTSFSRGIDRADLEGSLQTIRDAFATPEEINDSTVTAPSKRVKTLMPGYQKPFHGILAALTITLSRIREECLCSIRG